jgi:hypothetical protein
MISQTDGSVSFPEEGDRLLHNAEFSHVIECTDHRKISFFILELI